MIPEKPLYAEYVLHNSMTTSLGKVSCAKTSSSTAPEDACLLYLAGLVRHAGKQN
jgi:hypothetical protein